MEILPIISTLSLDNYLKKYTVSRKKLALTGFSITEFIGETSMKLAISIVLLLMLIAAIKSTFRMPVSLTKIDREHNKYASCKVCDSPDGKTCCTQ
ncbi:hypothetical protein OSCI_3410037 [Kamptonema sp. PCC 6506]|nr:hypothetical protein OSCI_3410037 [Kamptonema sp. PCC 6506]